MRITVSGGTSNYGVYSSSSSPRISDAIIIASGGTSGSGVYNYNTVASADIRNSSITGTTYSIDANTGVGVPETYISDSILTGLVFGHAKCSFAFLSNGTALDADCDP